MARRYLDAPVQRPALAHTSTALTAALVGFVLLGAPNSSMAQHRDTLGLTDAVEVALDANPSLKAARLRADAATQRIAQSGAPPDPRLSVGLMNRPIDGFGASERMTMNVVQWTQTFPWPGTLGFGKDRARYLADAEAYTAIEVERQILSRVKTVYYQLAFTDRALDVMQDTRELLRNFLDVSMTMYAVGSGRQQDALQAQVSVAQMTEDIMVMEQDRVALAARLNALLGRGAVSMIPALELPPASDAVPAVDSLMALAVESRPALHAARARVEAAEAGYRQARRELYPEVIVTVGYGQRPQFSDMATVMVGLSVPLWAASRQLPMRRELAAVRTMQEAMERNLYNETFAEITQRRADAERARHLVALYATSVLPQARAAVESALSAYRVGSVDYMTLVENELTVNRYEIASIRLIAEYHSALAALEVLIGTDVGGIR